MRLIDADELIKDRVGNDPVRIAAICAPTAYDVDKVVERLMCESINCHIMTYRAVEIVKSSGINKEG